MQSFIVPSAENDAEYLSGSLYDYPMLYEAVRGPTAEETASLSRILETHLGRRPTSVMDPACGPGSWLEPFARKSTFVAGNDISPRMVAVTRLRLHSWRSEITEGDMRTLSFRSGPFDAAFELSGALGMLLDVSSILSFLQSLGRALVQGGVALLDAHFRDAGQVGPLPRVCWSHGPVHLALGQSASVIYEILREDTQKGIEWVRRSVRVQGATGRPTLIMDEYPIKIWKPEDFIKMLAPVSGFQLEAVYREDGADWYRADRDDLMGERLVLLRRIRTESRRLNGGAA